MPATAAIAAVTDDRADDDYEVESAYAYDRDEDRLDTDDRYDADTLEEAFLEATGHALEEVA